jgi:hypothetical protein
MADINNMNLGDYILLRYDAIANKRRSLGRHSSLVDQKLRGLVFSLYDAVMSGA